MNHNGDGLGCHGHEYRHIAAPATTLGGLAHEVPRCLVSTLCIYTCTQSTRWDGAARVRPLLAEVERLSMPAVAITDHGNVHGAFEFYQQASARGIKPVIGI